MCSLQKQAMLKLVGLGLLMTSHFGCGGNGISLEPESNEVASADVALAACQESCQPISEVANQNNSNCVQAYTTCRSQGTAAKTCADSLQSCVANRVELQQEGSQAYVACVDSCTQHETESEMAQSEYALSKGHTQCHRWHWSKINTQCIRPCFQQTRQCKHDCRQSRKTCMQEVRAQWKQWKEDLQVKIEFCEAMFPDDEQAIADCIAGVLEGLSPPIKSYRRCWLEGFQCAFTCWDGLFECVSEC